MANSICALMTAAAAGEPSASEALFAALYAELHRLAKLELARRGGAGVTLSVTTLLHEAYVAIAGREGTSFPDRARFMGYAARVMRGLIVDQVRRRRAHKRGGRFEIMAFDTDVPGSAADEPDLVRLNDALNELAKVDQSLAEVVDLKFFCGFSFAEIASLRGVSERTAQRSWDKARLYLHQSLVAD
jgi:RNA polymerase sigma factor (TIGR02999 family)